MAVVLRREGSESLVGNQLPIDLRKAPQIVVKNTPIERSIVQPGAKITARSGSCYACEEPNREEVFRGTYKRRSVQLNECGFHGVNNQPYKDLGQVELNDGKLILDGLGQSPSHEQLQTLRQLSQEPPSPSPVPPVPTLVSPYKVKLRPKTPSQFPSELANLGQALEQGDELLETIRRGMGLFELIKRREAIKCNEEAVHLQLAEKERQNEWNEAKVSSHASLNEDQEEVIKEQTLDLPAIEVNGDGPSVSVLRQKISTGEQLQQGEDDGEKSQVSSVAGWGSWSYVYNQVKPPDLHLTLETHYNGGAAEDDVPLKEPLSSDCSEEIEHWYRMLCVLVWVLEAMRMESPHHMTPFSKCWNRERLVPNESNGKRAHLMNKAQLNKWEKLLRENQTLTRFHTQMRMKMPTQRKYPSKQGTTPTREARGGDGESLEQEKPTDTKPRIFKSRMASRLEEERKMMKQRKLNPLQMENLLTLLEEELSYSKKQSRNRINEIIKQADQDRLKSLQPKRSLALPPLPQLDVGAVEREFEESEERRRMIAHEQLTAMERDQSKALHQRYSSLKVTGNLWQDLAIMRQGVEIETTSMARRKLLMNYEWFSELTSMVPDHIQRVPKCSKLLAVLEDIATYMCEVGPKKMSRKKLIQVLATRKPWELRNPDIAQAIEFLTQKVIYIVAEDYGKWLEQHTLVFQKKI